MPSSTDNVKVGVCSVDFNGTDLGYTKGGVTVEVTADTHKVTVDQFGGTAVNEYVIGRNVTVTTPLAETTVDNLVQIMPGATKIVDSIDATKVKADVVTGVGTSLLASAAKLTLHPISATGVNEDIIVPKAATAGAINLNFSLDNERIFETVWTGYPDPATGLLFTVGDETAAA